MELVPAIQPALMAIPSDLTHTHPEFERLVSLISSRIGAQDSIQEQSSSALVVRQEMGYVYAAWNPLFPDLIKIGATMRAFPIMRVDEPQMCVIFPAATICERRITGKKERGYSGIQLMT